MSHGKSGEIISPDNLLQAGVSAKETANNAGSERDYWIARKG